MLKQIIFLFLVFRMFIFKLSCSLFFHPHQKSPQFLFIFSHRVVSSAYMNLLILFMEILIPSCDSSSLTFPMMYSACKLNKQGDIIYPCHTPFPIWNQSVVPCLVLTCFLTCIQVSQEAGKMLLHSQIFKKFPQFVVILTVQDFLLISEAAIFLELPCFLYDPTNVDNLISGFSAFSKPSLYIQKFSVQVLLKPILKDFEHKLASM